MSNKGVTLKPGRDKAIHQKHHWIFSGAIAEMPEGGEGEIFPVFSHSKRLLGHGYFNHQSAIAGRMLNFDNSDPIEAVRKQIQQAILLRRHLFEGKQTNAYRLINGEGDYLPGLVVDRYGSILILQISTCGMERLKSVILEELMQQMKPQALYEKSNVPGRREEGLKDSVELLSGSFDDPITIQENGHTFLVSIEQGQKTGFFLDQRETRLWVQEMSKDKRVLNAFAYTGSFSVYAAAGGAKLVDSIEISDGALEYAKKHMEMNGFSSTPARYECRDVFDYLREEKELPYDLVILDPPAFAKKKKDVIQACRGYKDINRLAMQKMPPSSYLLTCSCSYQVDPILFQKVIFQAAVEAGRNARLIGRHRMAADHPINLCHPDGGEYLKSLLIYLE
jgi:23S rRNA (cytosine1962-C5)-methyltransferase